MAKKPAAKKAPAKAASSGKTADPSKKASTKKGAAAKKSSSPAKGSAQKASDAKVVTAKPAPAVKRSAPSARERLADELTGLIPEIDAEGLLFLIRQANVLLHNKRVDELNAEMEQLNQKRTAAHKRAGTTARVGENVQEITVEIQRSPDEKTYYMIVDEQRHFLTSEEMEAVVKLSIKPERKSDALRFLYQYMYNERREILMDHGISNGKHPFFEALFYEVRSKFSL